ncbi:MAG: hypothetical protein ACFFE8_15540 [Candidatus Heimdallarchaeota archaeon]
MVWLRETHKKLLQTVIDQLPPYIERYSLEEQELLTAFFETLKYYEEADSQRERLSKRFLDYNRQYYQTRIYLKYPFLWFSIAYFATANLMISLAKYDGRSFYAYLARPFRRHSQSEGGFLLVKNQTPLESQLWEQLQIICARIELNLTEAQLLVLKNVYQTIKERGIHSLHSRQLKKQITTDTHSFPMMRELANFFKLLGSKWDLWFYAPAFDLKYLYFHLKLAENTPLTKIIDFQNPKNRTLCASRIHRVPDRENEYSGYLVIPEPFLEDLKGFLAYNKHIRRVVKLEMDEILTERVSFSLARYSPGKGWQERSPPSSIAQDYNRYITPEFNQTWHYTQFSDPLALIQFFCRHKAIYYFEDLPLDPVPVKRQTRETVKQAADERGLLKFLFEKKVCVLAFDSPRLHYLYSPYLFEVRLPVSSLDALNQIVSGLPFVRIFFAEEQLFLWAFLTAKDVESLETEYNCQIQHVISYHYPQRLQFLWYDSRKFTWHPPSILTS